MQNALNINDVELKISVLRNCYFPFICLEQSKNRITEPSSELCPNKLYQYHTLLYVNRI